VKIGSAIKVAIGLRETPSVVIASDHANLPWFTRKSRNCSHWDKAWMRMRTGWVEAATGLSHAGLGRSMGQQTEGLNLANDARLYWRPISTRCGDVACARILIFTMAPSRFSLLRTVLGS
jgi:hypothetical protein